MNPLLSHAALAIAAAVLAGLWQGMLIAGAAWLGLRCLPALGAATRYAIWLCALAAIVLAPVLTVCLAERQPQPVATAAGGERGGAAGTALGRPEAGTVRSARGPAVARRSVLTALTALTSLAAPVAANAAIAATPAAPRTSPIAVSPGFAAAVAVVWVLAAAARGLLLLLALRTLGAIRREARLWSAAHEYPVFLSDRVRVPLAAGFVRAAIILPASLVERLRPDALEAIVTHEVAHLRRRDVWTNALARVAHALAALSPAAWFVMRRLAMEREIACDDWVVARAGAGEALARVLASMAGGVPRAPLAAPSAFGPRHAIVVRIERLLDARPRRLRLSPPAIGAALALFAAVALIVSAVSPVLAYEPRPQLAARGAAGSAAAGCAMPARGIRMTRYFGLWPRSQGIPVPSYELRSAHDIAAQYGAAHVATFDLTVDSAGRVRKVVVTSPPRYPGMVDDITRRATYATYEPATRDCAPVTATIHTAVAFGPPRAHSASSVAPAYPPGWSARHRSACKVPSLFHTGVPAFPAALNGVALGTYDAAVRVHVDGRGAVTSAAVVTPSGQRGFDDALLAAARQATYPLTEASGFKQVRPAGAPLSWNAAHGSSTYAGCKPLPTDYVWSTQFSRRGSIGIPGTHVLLSVD